MPFGLDFKSLVIGAVLALYVYPMLVGMLGKKSVTSQAA
jgi:hypothetical protein